MRNRSLREQRWATYTSTASGAVAPRAQRGRSQPGHGRSTSLVAQQRPAAQSNGDRFVATVQRGPAICTVIWIIGPVGRGKHSSCPRTWIVALQRPVRRNVQLANAFVRRAQACSSARQPSPVCSCHPLGAGLATHFANSSPPLTPRRFWRTGPRNHKYHEYTSSALPVY
jgi:hypothetical protein